MHGSQILGIALATTFFGYMVLKDLNIFHSVLNGIRSIILMIIRVVKYVKWFIELFTLVDLCKEVFQST
jgi:hypothetical protein